MTYLSNLLPHPQKNKLIELRGNNNCDDLYKLVQLTKKPFFEWNNWIKEQLDTTLETYKKKRSMRLFNLGNFQKKKMQKKAEKQNAKDKLIKQ